MTTNKHEIIQAVVERGFDASMSDLARLCAIPGVSAKGESLEPCAELVAELMRAAGLEADLLDVPDGPPAVFGTLRSSIEDAPTVLFYNHYDVQPAEPLHLWTSEPFTLTFRDGKAFARGVGDDKGHITSRLLSLIAVRQACGGSLPFHVKFLAEGEEEVGSPHLGAFIEKNADLLRADACIWEEGNVDDDGKPVLYCGMRGIAYFELSCTTSTMDAHSGVGGSVLPNAAWRLVWALGTLKNSSEQILIPGHYAPAKLASLRDLELLDALPGSEAFLRQQFGLAPDGALGGARTTGLEFKRRAVFEPTLTICGLESGWQGAGAKTVLPCKATAKIDFRLVPDQDPDEVHKALRAHLDSSGFSDIEIKCLSSQKPARVDPDHPLVQLAAESAEMVYGTRADIVPIVGGSGPMWWFSGFLGMPITSPGVEYPGTRQHAPDENIRISDYLLGTRHLAHLLLDLPRLYAAN